MKKQVRRSRSAKSKEALQKRRRIIKWVIGILIVILLAAFTFGIYHLYRNTMSRILKTQTYVVEKLIATSPSNGVILRDENVIVAPKSGRWSSLVPNASYVKVNDAVAEIYEASSIREYDKALKALQENRKKDLDAYNSRLAFYDESVINVQKEILSIEKELQTEAVKKDPEAVSRLETRIETLESSIDELYQQKSTVSDNTQYWNQEEAKLMDILRKNSTVVSSVYDGVISFSVDEYEGFLSTKELHTLGLKDLSTFPYGRSKETPTDLVAGKPLCKTVQAPWYWVTSYTIAEAMNLKVGDEVKLVTMLGNVIYGKIDSMRQENDSIILAYKFQDLVAEALLHRFPSMERIIAVDYGLKVPSDVLLQKSKKTGVFTKEDGVAVFREVQVLQNRNGEAMITGLEAQTEIILNPRFALEGIRVGGE